MSGGTDALVRRNFALALTAISLVPGVPAALLLLLVVVNSINPMLLMFITSFTVRNDSGEPVRFWTVGQRQGGGIGPLPLYVTTLPALPTVGAGGFRVPPRMSVRVTYDWDDHNFTAIVVRRPSGELRVLDVDADHPRGSDCCSRHAKDEYVIPPLDSLRAPTAEERDAVEGLRRTALIWITVMLLAFLPLLLYRLQRRLRS